MLVRRLIVGGFAAAFCVTDWAFDGLNRRLVEGQDRLDAVLPDLLAEPLTLRPWEKP